MKQKIAIVSTCSEDWGGSEELWGRSVPLLQSAGFDIAVIKYFINRQHPKFVQLAHDNVQLLDIDPKKSIPKKVFSKLGQVSDKIALKLKLIEYKGEDFSGFHRTLSEAKPSLVIISQGINFDGLKLAYQCYLLGIPYVVVAQKAVDFYWPHKDDRKNMLIALQKAEKSCFVSHHNLRLTEEQFGTRLPNGIVIFNPVKLSGKLVPYPKSTDVYRLACVGRLFLLDKGQDIIIRILSEQKWKDRRLIVSFIGKGNDEAALRDFAALLGVENIEFKGQVEDIEAMWEDYHALLLPSRSEGLPLSMVEAMSAGRMVIISNAGGNAEIVEEGVTAFIGHPNEESFGDAMERAWQRRDEWEGMGKAAAAYVAANVPKVPESLFVELIKEVVKPVIK
jgi:glycosyltransferase involved in cell wall biosynthesis